MQTKENIAALGVESQRKQEYFRLLCAEQTASEPAEREDQVRRYETARAEMHEAMNRHHQALGFL